VARFILSPAAASDVRGILEFIQEHNADAMPVVRQAFLDAMNLIAERPLIGHRRSDITTADLRFWSVYQYLIVFRTGSESVEVVRVLHAARDLRTLLEPEE